MSLPLDEIIARSRQILQQAYGPRFQGLVWYGSTARGEASPESDIDLLVLLTPPVDYFTELWRIIQWLYPLQLESERLLSAKPVAADAYARAPLAFFQSAREEGIRS